MFPNSLIGIMFYNDYVNDIETTISSTRASNPNIAQSLQKFINWLSTSNQISVLESDLLEKKLLIEPLTKIDIQNIVDSGYLYPFRSSQANGLFYLSHQKIGELTTTINTMTKYILNTIKRKKYKEIYEEEFSTIIFRKPSNNNEVDSFVNVNEGRKKIKIKNVPRGMKGQNSEGLGWKYHLYDLIGRDLLYRVETGGLKGPLLRIRN